MIGITTIRRAVAATASVAALGLVAATGHATESAEASDPAGNVHAIGNAAADGAQLLGPELLGLSPEAVDTLVTADPELAASVSEGLRSGNPYTVEATLTDVEDRVEELTTDGNGLTSTRAGIVLPNPPAIDGSGLIVGQARAVIYWPPDLQLPELPNGGVDRERVIAEITEDLDAG